MFSFKRNSLCVAKWRHFLQDEVNALTAQYDTLLDRERVLLRYVIPFFGSTPLLVLALMSYCSASCICASVFYALDIHMLMRSKKRKWCRNRKPSSKKANKSGAPRQEAC